MSELNDDMWEQIELNNYGKGKLVHIVNEQAELIRSLYEQLDSAHKRGWEQGKQQASGICKADIQEHAITISAAQQETHNNCCNYLAKAIDAMEYNHGN